MLLFAGAQSGMEGEIFGANMMLVSTIERNYTVKSYPEFIQKSFTKNKLKHDGDQGYIVLSDLMSEEDKRPEKNIKNKSKFLTKLSDEPTVEHDIGVQFGQKESKHLDSFYNRAILGLAVKKPVSKKNTEDFWNLVNHDEYNGRLQTPKNFYEYEQSSSNTNDLPSISEFETPPPSKPSNLPAMHTLLYSEKDLEFEIPAVTESIYRLNEDTTKQADKTFSRPAHEEISEIEVPPPSHTDKNVYGQWTNSKYAGNVLNYLKSIKFHLKEKKIPQTIPLTKMSDHFPYASDLRVNIVRPPSQLQRKNLMGEKRFQTHYFQQHSPRHLRVEKRHAIYPEINVKIAETDIRSDILMAHAQTNPKNVEITHRSEPHNLINLMFQNIDKLKSTKGPYSDFLEKKSPPKPSLNQSDSSNVDFYSSNSLLTVLPFLKSIEYFTEENEHVDPQVLNSNDIYTKALAGGKWHNVLNYNADHTPRNLKVRHNDDKVTRPALDKKHVNIPLKYKLETNKLVNKDDPIIEKGRVLAMEVSNQSNSNTETVSILKYNHGWLPGHQKKMKVAKTKRRLRPPTNRNNFDKHIKIGNALNERDVIGINDAQKKQSFEGGNAKIPDIQRYRSDIDDFSEKDHIYVPPSLRPTICNNVELYDHILYVQPDGSVDMTHILSPLKIKNVGIQFVTVNYKSCSLDGTQYEQNRLLLINWSSTPVRLFGGAHARKTKDLCGFF